MYLNSEEQALGCAAILTNFVDIQPQYGGLKEKLQTLIFPLMIKELITSYKLNGSSQPRL